MVSGILVIAMLVVAVPVWGGQSRQFCLSCHTAHYTERGRCRDCHHGNPAAERKNIAHAGLRAGKYIRFTIGNGAYIKEGERLMDQLACRRCHASAGRGNRVAVSLDAAASRKSAGELVLSIRRPVANMPNFGLDDKQITMLVNSIFAGSQGRATDEAAPVSVHFSTSGKKRTDIFTTKCGGCHRMLSERMGAVGTGEVGPNLSGLFSEYYPKTFRNGEIWTARDLGAWLKNPREIKPWARMRPVTLTKTEMKELETIFFVSPGSNK